MSKRIKEVREFRELKAFLLDYIKGFRTGIHLASLSSNIGTWINNGKLPNDMRLRLFNSYYDFKSVIEALLAEEKLMIKYPRVEIIYDLNGKALLKLGAVICAAPDSSKEE